ncbi:acyl-CoA synthetase [Desulfosporosinus sp. HMP52]|uniref:long-chain-fatty-acid--CoA ligase n=1 Tax=Desulfosporosinus sp. HMP52 TaxID=1487923 RepID=UPI00051FCD39|nr:long-chain fatty acid--CoA ligase [Desulfosporosinus sp. HMP52]KGK90027.1 acyl-CoA synthetase [Desulfosporosinus sp. HMP52]
MSKVSTHEKFLPWTKHYDSEVPITLSYPQEPLPSLFHKSVKNHAEAIALIFFGRKISYQQLGSYINSLTTSLHKIGIQQGDRIALLLPNCPQYVISYYAILSLGAIVVPVNPLSTESELIHIFRDAQVRMVISLDLLAGRLENVRRSLHNNNEHLILEHTYYTGLNEFMPIPIKYIYRLSRKVPAETKARLPYCQWLKTLLVQKEQLPNPCAIDLYRDIAVLIYTGGTTGKPKGVMLTHQALVANASQGAAWVQMHKNDRLLAVLPIFHGFGMSVCMNAPLISGSSCVLIPRFNGDEILKGIHRYHPTLFAGVPTMFIGLINNPCLSRYNLSSLRGCFVGAAPLAPEVKRKFEDLTGSRLMEGYGLTEVVTAVCANPYRGVNKTGSIGIPFPDVYMQVKDLQTGKNLPPLEVGEISLTGPEVMLGYYNQPLETSQALREGWLYTGDIGYMDEDGYFYLIDRKKDMIISGGFNVYPREVEDVLYQYPSVKEACVIGIPDDYKGEVVKAFITLKEDASAKEHDVIKFCRQHLLPYKVPQQVEIRDELPMTAIGKILKRALREE